MFDELPFPARFLRTAEAGRFLGLSGRTLEKHRMYGTGPAYRKIGGRVVYGVEDLQAWAERARQTSTHDVRMVQPALRAEPRSFRSVRNGRRVGPA
ncbi:helix-turn-helix domain-containing protein [Phenylobacterium sp.]|jgi:predicted DNA-binding transcriptional regulator AlpA|uniref:helix-turn-helix transcriptional regulator n=1 Tax=Phenylobacterium sp. TaxID=1871053 RepID=UPI002F923921